MFGVKNDSKIIRLKRPETKIGRNRNNHVILNKSMKVSRFHAKIRFFEDIPFIIDVSISETSEWGVYIDKMPLPKNRWVEIHIGDVIWLGATSVEEEGCVIEIVDLEPEEEENGNEVNNVATEALETAALSFQTIDITLDDNGDGEVENKTHVDPQPSSVSASESKNRKNGSSVVYISDEDDDEIIFESPTIDSSHDSKTTTELTSLVESVAAPAESEFRPLDVTSTMNGLLKQTPIKNPPPEMPSFDEVADHLAEVVGEHLFSSLSSIQNEVDVKPCVKQEYHFNNTQDLCNVLNYSNADEIISLDSDEEDFPSSQLDTTRINDIPDFSSAFSMMYELKSEEPSDDEDVKFIGQDLWFGPLSQTIDDIKLESTKGKRKSGSSFDAEEQVSMDIDDSLPNKSNEEPCDEIDNSELLPPSPAEPATSSSLSESTKITCGVSRKKEGKTAVFIPIQALPLKRKKRTSIDTEAPSKRRSSGHSTSTNKEKREKVKALYAERRTEEEKTPKENKAMPKVKVTKSRGDFLLDTAPPVLTSASGRKSSVVTKEHTISSIKFPELEFATASVKEPSRVSPVSPSINESCSNRSILKTKLNYPKFMYENNSRPGRKKNVTFHPDLPSKCIEIEVQYEKAYISSYRRYEPLITKCTGEYDQALFKILHWNVKWLQEQQKCIEPPPIYSITIDNNVNEDIARIVKYKEELKQSMFRSLWNKIFTTWNVPNNDNLPSTQAFSSGQVSNFYAIEIEKVERPAQRHSYSLMTIHAKRKVLNFKDEDNVIGIGKLTILNFHVTEPSIETKKKTMAFAYIHYYNRCSEGDQIFYRIILKIFARSVQIVCGEAKMKVLNYARPFLKQFRILGLTETCPIIKQICDDKFHEDFNPTNKKLISKSSRILDDDQKKAVSTSLNCVTKSSSLSFIDGPFGTGKTLVIVSLVHELRKRDGTGRILVVTINEKLADDLVYRICKDEHVKNVLRFGSCDKINQNVKHCGFDEKVKALVENEGKNLVDVENEIRIAQGQLMKIVNEKMSRSAGKNDAVLEQRRQQCDKELQELRQENSKIITQRRFQIARSKVVETSDVVVVPYHACWSSLFENYFVPNYENRADFSPIRICIFDDANFFHENAMLIPQMLQVQHMIMVGDKTVVAYQNSPYHKMLLSYTNSNKNFVSTLSYSHRTHPEVSEWVIDEFKLKDVIKQLPRKRKFNLKHFTVIDHEPNESALCVSLVECILEMGIDRTNIGVLVTEESDKKDLREQLNHCHLLSKISVDVLNEYSAREMEIVIVCLPQSRIYDQWLYIALTRAKSATIICGNFETIGAVPLVTKMLDYAKKRNVFFSLRNEADQVSPERVKTILTC